MAVCFEELATTVKVGFVSGKILSKAQEKVVYNEEGGKHEKKTL